MNEITRITLAKTPYEIEIEAKKKLEAYLKKLEAYADEQEWFKDIEIRITEILGERGVQPNGVISSADVAAIRKQLGEPNEFLGEDDTREEDSATPPRHLFRDPNNAILGGVLSGAATYLGITPFVARAIFVICLFISFGTACILYLVLWAVIPPARTAAERLQLNGQRVSLTSIKQLRSEEAESRQNASIAPVVQKVLMYGLGIFAAIGAILSIIATLVVGFRIFPGNSNLLTFNRLPIDSWTVWLVYGMLVASGLLLTAFLSLVAYALFSKSFTQRIARALAAVTIVGIASFGTSVLVIMSGVSLDRAQGFDSRITKSVNLPEQFGDVRKIVLDFHDGTDENSNFTPQIRYIVSSDTPNYQMPLDASSQTLTPKVTYSEDGRTAFFDIQHTTEKDSFWPMAPVVTIYGPALDELDIKSGSVSYYNDSPQANIAIISRTGVIELDGTYKNVSILASDRTTATLDRASVENLVADTRSSSITAGVIRTLHVTQPDACPADSARSNYMSVTKVSSGKISFNEREQAAETFNGPCGKVLINEMSDEN